MANESYGFELFGEAADKPWELNSLALDPFKQARAVGETVSNCSAFESITIEGHWLDDLIHSNGFVLNSVEPEGGSLYRVTFVSKFIPYERNIILGGTLWLDASRMWVQTKYELILQSCGDMCAVHGELQYQQIGEYPFPRRLVKTYSGEGERPNQYVLDWTDVSTAVQAGDFRLTAFGLPEPDLRHPARDRASSLDFSARGGPRQFELTASNRGSRAITLMGFERCGPRGCWTVSPLPIALPPGAAATLRCRFNGRNDGDDAPVLTFYGDDHTGRMKTFMVTPP